MMAVIIYSKCPYSHITSTMIFKVILGTPAFIGS
jgi:hypothetical protein